MVLVNDVVVWIGGMMVLSEDLELFQLVLVVGICVLMYMVILFWYVLILYWLFKVGEFVLNVYVVVGLSIVVVLLFGYWMVDFLYLG